MDGQRFAIAGRVDADEADLQRLLALAHEAPVRPRCLWALHVDFPWDCGPARSVQREAGTPWPEAARSRLCMSLCALAHVLFERAGFNRWVPAMAALAPRDGRHPMMVVLGDFKGCEPGWTGQRVWILHMPGTPLQLEALVWRCLQRRAAPLFEALDAEGGRGLHLLLAALIRSRSVGAYEIERASLMLASDEWIPLEGAHEVPLHLLSGFMKPADRALKERAIQAGASVWSLEEPMSALPAQVRG